MDSTKHIADYSTHGIVEIKDFIEPAYYKKAVEYFELMKSLTLTGRVDEKNRTPEQIEMDKRASDLIKQIRVADDPALAYGFMLYNEASITKIYWTNRVGKKRLDKKEFFSEEKYLEWLTEIYTTLSGRHPKYHDPLYYYKLGEKSRSGKIVGTYDVMNSFRVFWNQTFLPILGMYLYEEDMKAAGYEREKYTDEDGTKKYRWVAKQVSIDAALENENGAGNHLEADMAKHSKTTLSVDEADTYDAVEDFLRSFTSGPLSEPVPLNTGAKAAGVTYKDVVLALVDGSYSSGKAAYQKFLIGPSIQMKILSKIKYEMNRHGFGLEDFANYLDDYRVIAMDILTGKPDATYRDVD